MSDGRRFAVTGAGGQLGGLVLERLVARYGARSVAALTRRPGALDAWAARGVAVRAADFDDPAGLPAALEGVDRLLVITTTHEATGHRVRQHQAVFDAAAAAGVEHVAFTSMPRLAPGHPSGEYADEYRASEQLLRTTEAFGSTILRNGPYAENLVLRATAAVRAGRLVSNAGDGRAGYISRADLATAAVAALAGSAARRRTLELSGAGRTQAELAAILSTFAERPVTLTEVADEDYPAAAAADGIPAPLNRLLAAHHAAVRAGWFDVSDADYVALVGGCPRPLESVLAGQRTAILEPAASD